MILGVMSDTHGNLALMFRAADLLRDRFGASVLAHLGDDWEDAEVLAAAAPEVWAVPGLWCDAFRDWRIPNARRETADGLVVALAHDEGTLARESAGAHILRVVCHAVKIDANLKSRCLGCFLILNVLTLSAPINACPHSSKMDNFFVTTRKKIMSLAVVSVFIQKNGISRFCFSVIFFL